LAKKSSKIFNIDGGGPANEQTFLLACQRDFRGILEGFSEGFERDFRGIFTLLIFIVNEPQNSGAKKNAK
jgi:hypothetical protein